MEKPHRIPHWFWVKGRAPFRVRSKDANAKEAPFVKDVSLDWSLHQWP